MTRGCTNTWLGIDDCNPSVSDLHSQDIHLKRPKHLPYTHTNSYIIYYCIYHSLLYFSLGKVFVEQIGSVTTRQSKPQVGCTYRTEWQYMWRKYSKHVWYARNTHWSIDLTNRYRRMNWRLYKNRQTDWGCVLIFSQVWGGWSFYLVMHC